MTTGRLTPLTMATAVAACGLAAGGTAGALLGTAMLGDERGAGVPPALLVVGSGAAALWISNRSMRRGRVRSLALGYVTGAGGALLVALAAATRAVPVLLAGSALLGAANASIFLSRYAAAEIGGGEGGHGRAIGSVLTATALGAVASPNLLGPSGSLADAIGMPRLSGLYLVAAAAFCFAAAILACWTPEAGRTAVTAQRVGSGLMATARRHAGMRVALLLLAVTNLVMVAVMAVCPVDLSMHEGLALVGIVISVHVAFMFGPSPLSGRLADRAGALPVAALGLGALVAAGIAGALGAGAGTPGTMALLAVVGLGWNLGVVGASALLTAVVPAQHRAAAEGLGEAAMGLAAAIGAPIAGLVLAARDLPSVWLLTAGVAAVALVQTARRAAGPLTPSR